MTVDDFQRELALGSKWAVETRYRYFEPELGEEVDDTEVFHYQIGSTARCPYLNYKVQSIRSLDNEIIVSIDLDPDPSRLE